MTNKSTAIMIAGISSGSGKTTASLVIMNALKERGFDIAPFKAGPDYIDPGYHLLASGRQSTNLDLWLMPGHKVREVFHRNAAGNRLAIIEGVMGLYDGIPGTDSLYSSAHLAKVLDVPVILVIDGSKIGDSVAAVALGFKQYDPQVDIAGVLFNNISSARHYDILEQAVSRIGLRSFGYLPKQSEISVEERHLGLMSVHEQDNGFADKLTAFARSAANTIDLDLILSSSKSLSPKDLSQTEVEPTTAAQTDQVRIAVARDEAFCFYYEDSLETLRSAGAELVNFSPVHDPALPPDISGIILGGGFPEMFAEQLSANKSMRQDIRSKAKQGIPVYAECGGLIYTAKHFTSKEGKTFEMAGILNINVKMNSRRVSLGYVEATLANDCIIGSKGTVFKGHKFHWSSAYMLGELDTAYHVSKTGTDPTPDGFISENVFVSYVHLHFSGCPGAADKFVSYCKKRTEQGVSS